MVLRVRLPFRVTPPEPYRTLQHVPQLNITTVPLQCRLAIALMREEEVFSPHCGRDVLRTFQF